MNLNFKIIIFIFCVSVIAACKTKKPVATIQQVEVVKQDTVKVEVEAKEKEPLIKKSEKQTIAISLLMPFNFERNLADDSSDIAMQVITTGAMPWIHFYEGAKLAADSFSNENIEIKIDVFDSAVDSGMLATLIKGGKLYQNKIVIAAVPAWANKDLAKQATLKNVTLVFPQHNNIDLAPVSYLMPTNSSMISSMCSWLSKTYAESNVVVFYRDNARERELGKLFANSIDSLSERHIKTKLVNNNTQKFEGLISNLDKTKTNCIVVASSDEAFVSPILNKLNEKTSDYKMTVCGLPTWENFETIDVKVLENLNTHYFTSTWINYYNEEVTEFRKRFITHYMADPMLQAFQAFYFVKGLSSLQESGSDNNSGTLNILNGNFSPEFFLFQKNDSTSGFSNNAISILKHQNFELIKVK